MIWAATLLLAIASLALGIGQRVWEIPNVPLPFDVEAYARSLSTPLGTEAGVLTHSALHEMQQRIDLARLKFGAVPQDRTTVHYRVDWVTATNMPIYDEEVKQALQFVCQGDWISKLRRLGALPRGAIMNPREMKTIWPAQEMQQAIAATIVLSNRARLSELHDQLGTALDDYETALELTLTMAHQANDQGFSSSEQAARIVLDRLRVWSIKAAQSPELLHRARDLTQRFGASLPSPVDADKASYLATRSFLSQPELPGTWPIEPDIARDNSLSLVPWEAERRLRLLNAFFAGRIKAASLPFAQWVKNYREGSSGMRRGGWIAPTSNGLPVVSGENLARWLHQTWWQSYLSPRGIPLLLAKLQASIRAIELRFALISYAVQNRRAAETLADLVPKYIGAIPSDPYDGKPFRYRVSAGENIAIVGGYEVETSRIVRPGQGILWCVGPDLVDDHGTVEDNTGHFLMPKKKTADIVFIVPSVNELLR